MLRELLFSSSLAASCNVRIVESCRFAGTFFAAGFRAAAAVLLVYTQAACIFSPSSLQSPFIPTARTGFREVRVGDVYSEGARRCGRRRLLLRLLQRGHRSLCQTGPFFSLNKKKYNKLKIKHNIGRVLTHHVSGIPILIICCEKLSRRF